MKIVNSKLTGLTLKQYRIINHYSVNELANRTYVSPCAVYHWECGLKLPNLQNLVMLSDLYKCNIDDLLIFEYI